MKTEEIRVKAKEAWAAVEQMPDDHPLRWVALKEAIEWNDLLSRREMEE
ncbi:hypothetical protein [Bordetella bronchiseptica]|nr:hypothetical protein [Bordetella bronchiseptica]